MRVFAFVLNLHKIHAGGLKVFEVFVDGRLAGVVAGIEVQEKGRRNVGIRN